RRRGLVACEASFVFSRAFGTTTRSSPAVCRPGAASARSPQTSRRRENESRRETALVMVPSHLFGSTERASSVLRWCRARELSLVLWKVVSRLSGSPCCSGAIDSLARNSGVPSALQRNTLSAREPRRSTPEARQPTVRNTMMRKIRLRAAYLLPLLSGLPLACGATPEGEEPMYGGSG